MASLFKTVRKAMIDRLGRPATFNRLSGGGGSPITTTSTAITGFLAFYSPSEMAAGQIMQGDARLAIGVAELDAVSITPRARDQVVIDGKTWAVQGSFPVYDGSTCIGYDLWLRGGAG